MLEKNHRLVVGDVKTKLKELKDKSVQCCITSPPYWGLRDYGTATWIGGSPDCSHKRDSKWTKNGFTGQNNLEGAVGDGIYKDICPRCGAIREDKQIGLELTPEKYVESLVEVFREVHRVLKDDGVLWLNLGDTYNNLKVGSTQKNVGAKRHNTNAFKKNMWGELKPKDLIGIPWRVAFALQADGWHLRQDIIWAKPNPMPESVKDRCTKAHEYIFMLTKKPKYFFDSNAIKEKAKTAPASRNKHGEKYQADYPKGDRFSAGERTWGADGKRNKRSVWTVPVRPFKESHFATFPIDLIEPCVLASSRKKDWVLDPFFGAGTTGLAAQRNERKWIGIELNPEYAKIARRRLMLDKKNKKII